VAAALRVLESLSTIVVASGVSDWLRVVERCGSTRRRAPGVEEVWLRGQACTAGQNRHGERER
jgi:hypothetical protein